MDLGEWVQASESDGFWMTLSKDLVAAGYGAARSLASKWPFGLLGLLAVASLDLSSFSVSVAVVSVSVSRLTPVEGFLLGWAGSAAYDYVKNPETDVR